MWYKGLLAIASSLVVFVLGYATAAMSSTTCILVDYDSGRLRQTLTIWPLVVRDEVLRSTLFCAYPLPDGRQGLTGAENWHTACVFRANSMQSPNCAGGQVVNQAASLASWFPSLPKLKASELKQEFLTVLSKGDVAAVKEFVHDTEIRLLENNEYRPTTREGASVGADLER